ncbi:MAG TPA: LemA family protein [Candidatus Angelobacter sp.]|nr:LemA family protein [Candidatus Angelobacter sp.]
MDNNIFIAGVIAAFILLTVLLIWSYNRLVRLRNRVRNAWSDVDVQLKRRHDLIPGLVETVRGYMTHERQTLEAVTSARAQAMTAGAPIAARVVAETALSGAVGNLFAVAERYPTLKAASNFTLLQEQLNSTENCIAFARQFYNESVMQYNTAIATFPRNLIAGAMGFSRATMFAAEAGDRPNVAVKVTN